MAHISPNALHAPLVFTPDWQATLHEVDSLRNVHGPPRQVSSEQEVHSRTSPAGGEEVLGEAVLTPVSGGRPVGLDGRPMTRAG